MPPRISLLSIFILFLLPAAAKAASVDAEFRAARTNVYVGEVLPVTLVIETEGVRTGSRIELQGMPSSDKVSFGSFREAPIQRQKKNETIQETRRFKVDATFRESGPLRLAPGLKLQVVETSRSPFGVSRSFTSRTVEVDPLRFEVKPVPDAGRPQAYAGAIGQFTFDVHVQPTNVMPGDLVKVRATISGTGNIEEIQPGLVTSAPAFNIYDTEPVSRGEKTGRSFRQILVPLSPEAELIPEISFSFFNPSKGRYITVRRGPFKLNFQRAPENAIPPDAGQTVPPEQPDPQDRDLAPETREPIPGGRFMVAVFVFWLTSIVLALVCVLRLRRGWMCGAAVLLIALLAYPSFENRSRELFAAVVRQVTSDAPARLYPSESSLVTFRTEKGTEVRILKEAGHWFMIADRNRRGWVHKSAFDLSRNGARAPE
jgi:hypothetical protein